MPHEPDWDALIAKARAHPTDKSAIEELFASARPYLVALLVSLYPSEGDVVEDGIQAALLKFWKILITQDARKLSLGYLVVMAKHCLVDEIRKRKHTIPLDDLLHSEDFLRAHSTFDSWGPDSQSFLLQIGLLRMEARCRFILEQYYIAGMKAPLLAQELGVQADSVHMLIKRCRDKLRHIMQGALDEASPS